MDSQEQLKDELFALLKTRPGDGVCADCGAASPEWASASLGIFICVECSGVHRQMGTHISRVKSVRLDNWKRSEVEDMKRHGNAASNKDYLALLAPLKAFYGMPRLPEDGGFVREQWVRAKYERREFFTGMAACPQLQVLTQPVPLLTGKAVKRGAKRKNWKTRWCEVMGTTFAYYGKQGDAAPKGIFSLAASSEVSVVREEFEGHLYVIQFQVGERPFYVSLESPAQLLHWVCVLRSIRNRLVAGQAGVRRAAAAPLKELLLRARSELVLKSRKAAGKGGVVEDCFYGAQLIDWLMSSQELESRDDAVAVANEMLSAQALHHATLDLSSVMDGPDLYQWGKK